MFFKNPIQFLATAFLFLGTLPFYGQARIVFNNNPSIVIQNGAYLVIDNNATNALASAGGSIISEGENNVVKWNINNNTGNYVIPFMTKSLSMGGNGTSIPLSVNITSAGTNSGSIIFSTYETNTDYNTAYPSDVTNMYSSVLAGDGSLYAIDRFWRIEASGYSVKPGATFSFSYDDAANEMGGSNTINENNLQAQRFNSNSGSWDGILYGADNAVTNTVSGVTVSAADFYKTWTLTDYNVPLPLENSQNNSADSKTDLPTAVSFVGSYTEDQLNVIIKSTYEGTFSIRVQDLTGKTVVYKPETYISKGQSVITIDNIVSSGMYLFYMEDDKNYITGKIYYQSK